MSLHLSKERRELIRSLGVEDEFPDLVGYRLPGVFYTHLDPRCIGGRAAASRPLRIPLLEFQAADSCALCTASPLWGRTQHAMVTLSLLGELLEQVLVFENVLVSNFPRFGGHLSPTSLGDLVSKGARILHNNVHLLSEGPDSTFVGPAALLLADRFRKVQAGAVELLRSPAGRSAVAEYLCHHRAELPVGRPSLFVLADGTVGEIRAAVHAFGEELTPGRYLVQGPPQVLAALSEHAISSPLSVRERPPEVVETASALWEPNSLSDLGSAATAIEMAVLLLSTSSNA